MNAYKKQDHKNVAIINKASQAEKGNHKEYNCQRCPRNLMARGIKHCRLYKDIKDYENVKARMKKETEFNKYMKNSPEVFSRLFKGWARAIQIFKYEIGIFKELRQEKKGDEINLVGICDSNWNAEASLKEYQADAIKHAIIKEELDDGDAIQEYYNDEY